MAKTLWNGTLELDEIAIPVGLAATVSDKSEGFRMLHADGIPHRIAMRPYCESHEKLLEPDEIVRGWELSPGQYVVVDGAARDALERVESRRMPIDAFVPAAALEPALIRKRYQLIPSSTVGARAYFLFAAAIAELDVAGLVRFTWRSEQLGAVHSRAGRLELHSLHFGEDLVDPEDLGPLIDASGPIDDRLLELARDLVDRHTRKLEPGDLNSIERPRVRELLEKLLAGQEIVRPDAPVEQDQGPTAPAELEGALRRSLKQAPRRRRRTTAAAR